MDEYGLFYDPSPDKTYAHKSGKNVMEVKETRNDLQFY